MIVRTVMSITFVGVIYATVCRFRPHLVSVRVKRRMGVRAEDVSPAAVR